MKTPNNNIPKLRFPDFSGEWEENKLGEICKIQTGNKDTQNKVENGLYPFFVRSNNVERINSYSFDGEAILTSGDGVGVGKNYHYIIGKFDYHQRVYCLNTFNTNIVGKYIFYVFSENFQKRVIKLSAKNSVDSVRRDFITDMKISLPTLPEQTKIATFLTAIDEKIQHLSKKKALLQQYKKGVMHKIFNQEIRFKDENGNNYPDWEEKKLGEIGEFKNGVNKSRQDFGFGFPFINLMDVFGKSTISNLKLDLVNVNEKELKLYELKKGDVLFIRSSVKREGVGETSLVLEDLKNTVFSGFLIRFRDEKIKFEIGFKKYCFSTKKFRENLLSFSTTSANTNINQESLNELSISFPTLPEQTKIATFLTSIDEKIDFLIKQLENTQQYKKGLLQQMFC